MDDALLLWNWWGKSRNVNRKGSTGLLWSSLSTQRPELERLLLPRAGIAGVRRYTCGWRDNTDSKVFTAQARRSVLDLDAHSKKVECGPFRDGG